MSETLDSPFAAVMSDVLAGGGGGVAGVARLLCAMAKAAEELLAADFDAGLRGAVRALGEGTRLDRVYVVRYDHAEQAGYFVAEHCAPGIETVTSTQGPGPYAYADYEEVMRPLMNGEVYSSPLSTKTGVNAEFNRATGAMSDIFVPIFVCGVFWGMIGFDDCVNERVFSRSETEVLRGVAAMIAAAVARHDAEAARLAAERGRADENARLAEVLERVAAGARWLMNGTDFEPGLLRWLGELGSAMRASRATYYDCWTHAESGLPTLRMLCEWCRPGLTGSIPVSFAAPFVIDPRGVEKVFDDLLRGVVSAVHVDECAEPMRSFLAAQGNATVLVVPIFMDGRQHGAISYDFVERRAFTPAILAVLQTAADTLSVILKRNEAVIQALSEREARLAATVEANAALTRALGQIAVEPDITRLPEALLLEMARAADAQIAYWFEHDAAARTLTPKFRVFEGRVLDGPVSDEPGWMRGAFNADISPAFDMLCETDEILFIDTSAPPNPMVWPDTPEWHRKNGRVGAFGFVIKLGRRALGLLGMGFTHHRSLTAAGEQLIRSLSNQFALASQLVRLAEQGRQAAVLGERNRLARDLHDTLAQGFTGVLAQLGAVEGAIELKRWDEATAYFERAKQLARVSLAEARSSVHALRPETNQEPLLRRLERMVLGMVAGTTLAAEIVEDGEALELSPAADWCAHKCVQESLANAVKHSGARNFTVRLRWMSDALLLDIADDGAGYEAERVRPGLGLITMRERAVEAGGRLHHESRPGAGTRLRLELPAGRPGP